MPNGAAPLVVTGNSAVAVGTQRSSSTSTRSVRFADLRDFFQTNSNMTKALPWADVDATLRVKIVTQSGISTQNPNSIPRDTPCAQKSLRENIGEGKAGPLNAPTPKTALCDR